MIRHWTGLLRLEADPRPSQFVHQATHCQQDRFCRDRHRARHRADHQVHARAWIVCIAIPVLFVIMKSIQRHYENVSIELTPEDDERFLLPARVHAVVLVVKIHEPTLRALAYAQPRGLRRLRR